MKEYNKCLAINLLKLAKDHKKKCDGDCSISLFLVGEVYKELLGRALTDKERKVFI